MAPRPDPNGNAVRGPLLDYTGPTVRSTGKRSPDKLKGVPRRAPLHPKCPNDAEEFRTRGHKPEFILTRSGSLKHLSDLTYCIPVL